MPRNKILYAENYEGMRNLVKISLEEEFPDYYIETHNDGISLSQRLEQDVSDVALVVTDNQMPGYSGSRITKDYSRREGLKEIPFILFYGLLDDGELGKQAVEDGAFGYVLKGGEYDVVDELVETIKKALSK